MKELLQFMGVVILVTGAFVLISAYPWIMGVLAILLISAVIMIVWKG